MSYNQNFDISDSAVEAYYGWIDDSTPCARCGHPFNEHKENKCNNKYVDECDCPEWLEGEYEGDRLE